MVNFQGNANEACLDLRACVCKPRRSRCKGQNAARDQRADFSALNLETFERGISSARAQPGKEMILCDEPQSLVSPDKAIRLHISILAHPHYGRYLSHAGYSYTSSGQCLVRRSLHMLTKHAVHWVENLDPIS